MKIILKHWGITTPASNVIHITPTTLRVVNDDKVDYKGSMKARQNVYGEKPRSGSLQSQYGKTQRFKPNIPTMKGGNNPWNR